MHALNQMLTRPLDVLRQDGGSGVLVLGADHLDQVPVFLTHLNGALSRHWESPRQGVKTPTKVRLADGTVVMAHDWYVGRPTRLRRDETATAHGFRGKLLEFRLE